MKADAIIFDKDGTLLEFDRFWVKVSIKAIELVMKKLQVKENLEDEILRAIGVNDGVCDVNSVLSKGTYFQIGQEFCKVLNSHGYEFSLDLVTKEVINAYNESQVVGEVVATTQNLVGILKKLKEQGKRLAIVTTDNEHVTNVCLEKLGVYGLFDAIYTDDGKTPTKPNPSCAYAFCKKFNLSLEKVVMVGDTLTDVKFAQNAGIKVIGLAKNEQNKKVLQDRADVIINDLSALPEILG
ncbi:MAG: HAD family hydrolase [Clostridia bacterium]|nr:HAD family hydrolase [Clostridia bacterium]